MQESKNMLQFPEEFMGGEKCNEILKKFVNDRLIGIMAGIMADKGYEPEKVEEGDVKFAKKVSVQFLPKGYPVSKANHVFLGMYNLLKAQEELVPEITMEYVLDAAINWAIEQAERAGGEPVEQVPEREFVLASIQKELDGEGEDIPAQEILEMYEDLREYIDVCFWDMDFALLDQLSGEQLCHSDLNKILGIMSED